MVNKKHYNRRDEILMATGDNGHVSWQPVQDIKEATGHDLPVVAGGLFSGTRALADAAVHLLRMLDPLTLRFPRGYSYDFPRTARQKLVVATDDDGDTPPAPLGDEDFYEVMPDKADIVAAMYAVVQTGSSAVLLNDNALTVMNNALGVDDDDDAEPDEGVDEDGTHYYTIY